MTQGYRQLLLDVYYTNVHFSRYQIEQKRGESTFKFG